MQCQSLEVAGMAFCSSAIAKQCPNTLLKISTDAYWAQSKDLGLFWFVQKKTCNSAARNHHLVLKSVDWKQKERNELFMPAPSTSSLINSSGHSRSLSLQPVDKHFHRNCKPFSAPKQHSYHTIPIP